MTGLAPGIRILNKCTGPWSDKCGRIYIFIASFLVYASFHLSRKPISVVKSVLHGNCVETAEREGKIIVPENASFCYWKPFDKDNYASLFGALDLGFLASYAVTMFLAGHIADRFHLRVFLTFGCILTGIMTCVFGLGYYLKIHSFAFYLIVQIISGAFQSSGWPAAVACMGNWFGKARRGFFMGVWNAHTSVGNILGSLIAGAFVESDWALSFIVPGLIIAIVGVLVFFFMVPYPEEVGIRPPNAPLAAKDEFDYTIQSSTSGATSSVPEDLEDLTGSTVDLVTSTEAKTGAVSIIRAIRVPGVIEYSFALFFAKLVSYTFLFWLPQYIMEAGKFDPSDSAVLSIVFDIGGIAGGVLAGYISDRTSASATVCVAMLILGIPSLYLYYAYGILSATNCIVLLIPLGLFVNGPYALISTAITADLGTHPSLQSDARALSTVTGIIDGTGSAGAALGPLFCGLLAPYGWFAVYLMLMLSLLLGALVRYLTFGREPFCQLCTY
ncbi:unnamed protein product [Calicophoron daubneyi]|uniref:Sugar phosphate exchanger 3 n=1 Tax=Calicophoron daubneyi TaxID=300641 RepID=A0AAV2SWU0_CALDB